MGHFIMPTNRPVTPPDGLDDPALFFRAAYLAGRISALHGEARTVDPVPVRELLEVLTPGEARELGEALRGILARRRTSAAALPADRFDVARLTNAQFDGVACVRCHATDAPMVQVGHGENGPLFQCAGHDAAPACPPWCTAGDHGGVAAGERTHWSVSADLPVTLEDPANVLDGGDTVALMVDLALNEGDECGPVVELGDTTGRHGWTLTLEEADQVADRLRGLTAQGRRGSTVRRPGCAPWCSEHRDSAPAPEDQLCRHTITSTAFGEILLSYSLDDGPMVNLYRTEEELTFPNAEALARVILAVLAGHKGGEAL